MLSSNIAKLEALGEKLYFTVDDVAQGFGIERASSRVFCSRYVRQGLLVRLKNNFYTTAGKWKRLTRSDLFKLANVLQVPSYISLMSALAYYDVTTQVQSNYQESVCLKRSVIYSVREAVFHYVKVREDYYSDFIKRDGIFIATGEKALLDAVYLYSFGKYKFDMDSLDMKKMDLKELKRLIKNYPQKTKDAMRRLCGI